MINFIDKPIITYIGSVKKVLIFCFLDISIYQMIYEVFQNKFRKFKFENLQNFYFIYFEED